MANARPLTRAERAERVRRACAERGVRIEQRGDAYHLQGPGVDLTVSSLSLVRDADLARPHQYAAGD